MTLHILGLDPSKVDFDPDYNPGGLRDSLPEGGTYLRLACDLLDQVAPEKGSRLRHILDHDLVQEEGLRCVIPLLELGRIFLLLEDVEDDVRGLTDEHWRVRPEHAAAVQEKAPELVITFVNEEGHMVSSLGNTVSVVLTLRNFLNSALQRGLEVSIS